jgi:hypothetical protein
MGLRPTEAPEDAAERSRGVDGLQGVFREAVAFSLADGDDIPDYRRSRHSDFWAICPKFLLSHLVSTKILGNLPKLPAEAPHSAPKPGSR